MVDRRGQIHAWRPWSVHTRVQSSPPHSLQPLPDQPEKLGCRPGPAGALPGPSPTPTRQPPESPTQRRGSGGVLWGLPGSRVRWTLRSYRMNPSLSRFCRVPPRSSYSEPQRSDFTAPTPLRPRAHAPQSGVLGRCPSAPARKCSPEPAGGSSPVNELHSAPSRATRTHVPLRLVTHSSQGHSRRRRPPGQEHSPCPGGNEDGWAQALRTSTLL